MNTGQTMLVVLALAVFASISLVIYKMNTDTKEMTYSNKLTYDAITLAQSLIEEAWAKRFDESSDENNFTDVSDLGTESGESYPNIDDVDDYIDFPSTKTLNSHTYDVDIEVYYVNNDGDSLSSISKNKKLKINVKDDDYNVDVTLEQIFSYLE